MEDNTQKLVLEIKRRIDGIGPGFKIAIVARPDEWRALLEKIECVPVADGGKPDLIVHGDSVEKHVLSVDDL